ncbi:MAG TPA: hypothetical protein IGS40_18405, partial [Trichormus sp. M33_DOE_039]|nr:hypothetical protein [Trichormus sp. M33_DOE_039]
WKSLKAGVAESWDDYDQLKIRFQLFQPPIHPTFMQIQNLRSEWKLPIAD